VTWVEHRLGDISPNLLRLTAIEVERVVKRDSWYLVRQSGSHRHYAHDTKLGIVTVPAHAGEILHPKTLKSIMERAGLTEDDLRSLL
jgi:predicted RNA binding protein YcfA (HicA-like mRNA interferase family)